MVMYNIDILIKEEMLIMKLLYDGEEIGTILTNRSLTIDECLEMLEIDIYEHDMDFELFTMVY